MYDMWKRKQVHEDNKKMYWTKIPVKKLEKMGMTPSGRSRPRQKNGWTGRGVNMVQKVFGIRETKNGKEWDQSC